MALSGKLATAGYTADRLETRADVTFSKGDDGWRVASSRLTVKGSVPGIDDAGFNELANAAKDGCPISQALRGNVELSVEAALESRAPA
jgi:osmotically inducible protein OsmC